jgi:outer membrane protein assembly factor BamB
MWSIPLSSGKLIEGIFATTYYAPTNSILCLGSLQSRPILYMVSANSGKILWQWQDLFSASERIFNDYPYTADNILIINSSPNIYAINLSTGVTQWKLQKPPSNNPRGSGIGKTYFMVSDSLKLFSVNTTTGESLYRFQLTNDTSNAVSTFNAPVPIIDNQTQDTLLLSAWSYGFYQNAFSATYLLLYNLTQKRIIYNMLQREGVASGTNGFLLPNRIPTIDKDKIYLGIGKSFQCNNLKTGSLLWRKTDFEGNFFESGVLVVNDKVYSITSVGELFCLNASTGAVIWKTSTKGLSSTLLHLNGVIYLTSIGDGKLYAIDANTGAYIWQLRSPDDESSGGQSYFKDNVTTDGKNIFVSTYLNLYCYKAAR